MMRVAGSGRVKSTFPLCASLMAAVGPAVATIFTFIQIMLIQNILVLHNLMDLFLLEHRGLVIIQITEVDS